MKARLSHVSVMSSTNMLKQIKARREVSMFASQPQANGTNDQIIWRVLIQPWRLRLSSKFPTFGASLVNDNGERCLIFNMQNGGNATANPQRTFPSSCAAASPAAADSAWRPCHLAFYCHWPAIQAGNTQTQLLTGRVHPHSSRQERPPCRFFCSLLATNFQMTQRFMDLYGDSFASELHWAMFP